MMSLNIKKCVLMLGLSVALSTVTYAAQEGNIEGSAREKLLNEAISLLDKVELSSPRSQVEIMKVRERLVKLQNLSTVEDEGDENAPELMFSRSGGTTTSVSRNNKASRVNFYNSCRTLRNGDLLSKLRGECSKHKAYEYSHARELVILGLDNRNGDVECVYTGRVFHVGDKMPSSTDVNIEHTWPQSKGAKGNAKTDLHHLYATESKANSIRGNHPFGNVDAKNPKYCVGGSKFDGDVFEVRKQHRGNVARSMFYFATVYNQKIDEAQEKVLRQWHKEDPVDANEIARNDKIESLQNNRNPYVDHPEYVDMIEDF